jgi:hypothetical protein
MKILTALVLAQCALIVLLLVRVVGIESSIEETLDGAPSGNAVASDLQTILAPRKSVPTVAFDEERLRLIIREELNALDEAEPGPLSAATPDVAADTDPRQDIEYDYRLEEVRRALDYYAQSGQISDTEMARLEADIGRLRSSDREAMLRRLVRELNSGAIEGRL